MQRLVDSLGGGALLVENRIGDARDHRFIPKDRRIAFLPARVAAICAVVGLLAGLARARLGVFVSWPSAFGAVLLLGLLRNIVQGHAQSIVFGFLS